MRCGDSSLAYAPLAPASDRLQRLTSSRCPYLCRAFDMLGQLDRLSPTEGGRRTEAGHVLAQQGCTHRHVYPQRLARVRLAFRSLPVPAQTLHPHPPHLPDRGRSASRRPHHVGCVDDMSECQHRALAECAHQLGYVVEVQPVGARRTLRASLFATVGGSRSCSAGSAEAGQLQARLTTARWARAGPLHVFKATSIWLQTRRPRGRWRRVAPLRSR